MFSRHVAVQWPVAARIPRKHKLIEFAFVELVAIDFIDRISRSNHGN